ncbi:MarC family protein [Porphyromonas circumdentaria]|uniref:UPF0056 membrane protein n=1 Tax=Porphyromonas circumdentaria TaxID=29524 RepID=A0A1T4NAA8_9PORP|nr:MarC family protein [Porphyromonas circumdentaria]MBB6276091.1 multiple antibiotic resistance protein [Porphyromonas circumdentaria]MDO4722774.1 MarC family protein [Porphyromonas circumdentaria]SJZ76007.1 multiple antibiotic resistance protein [Porphyromonas circumdentaria]
MWDRITADFASLSIEAIGAAFALLFAAVDIIGAIPIVLDLKQRGKKYSAEVVTLGSGVLFFAFLFIGEPMLSIFDISREVFSVAGAIVLFVLAVEMLFGIQIFKDDGPEGGANFVPLVFPLFAGAATFTTLLTLRSDGLSYTNISVAMLAILVLIYLMLRFVGIIERVLGKGGIFALRKFFGVILLAISANIFIKNLVLVITSYNTGG